MSLLVPPMFAHRVPAPCNKCNANCCTRKAGWKFVTLTYREQRIPMFKKRMVKHEETGQVGFWYDENGDCPFLDAATRKCTVYDERPANCRNFDCRYCAVDSTFFKNNPGVVRLIQDQIAKDSVQSTSS